jgi:Uma2 family endonuclease
MVMIRQVERPYTADDLAQMPDDGRRYEVLGGELIVSPSLSDRHQTVLTELMLAVGPFIREQRLGKMFPAPFDVYFDERNSFQPDLVIVLRQNLRRIHRNRIVGPPDLIMEIISPSSRVTDRVKKAAAYARFGVSEYWLVDPDTETILGQELHGDHYVPIPLSDGSIRSNILEGLAIDPRSIFVEPEWMYEEVEE